MREDGLREVYRRRESATDCVTRRGPAVDAGASPQYLRSSSASRSSPAGASRSTCARATGSRRRARLRRGFIILIDYGHEARELYSVSALGRHADRRSAATRWAARRSRDVHAVAASIPASRTSPRTSTSRASARPPKQRADDDRLPRPDLFPDGPARRPGLGAGSVSGGTDEAATRAEDAAMPGGLGSTLKVLILGKGVGTPALQGCSHRARVT